MYIIVIVVFFIIAAVGLHLKLNSKDNNQGLKQYNKALMLACLILLAIALIITIVFFMYIS